MSEATVKKTIQAMKAKNVAEAAEATETNKIAKTQRSPS